MSDKELSDKDKALFRYIMQSVKPLSSTTKREPQASLTPKIIAPAIVPKSVERSCESSGEKIKPQRAPAHDYSLSNHYLDTVQANTSLSYCSQSIPGKRLRELRNGQIPYEARLDLHGLQPDAASDALCKFIMQQCQMGKRCLLIIHGKGGRHGEAPILKNHVNHWLQQLPQVLAFHSALARHGGNGAVYVLLKRQREI